MKEFCFKPKGIKQTVEIQVREVKYIGGCYLTKLDNDGYKNYEFAVCCNDVVTSIFIMNLFFSRDHIYKLLADLIRKEYRYISKPTWKEVKEFAVSVLTSIDESNKEIENDNM